MKLKSLLIVVSSLAMGVMASSAANFIVLNIESGGPGDTLFATATNSLMGTGTAAIGYFELSVTQANIDTVPELYQQLSTGTGGSAGLGSFHLVTSAVIGATASYGSAPGWAEQADYTSIGVIGNGNTLIGRVVYGIFTNATVFDTTAGAGHITSSSNFGLFAINPILVDAVGENAYQMTPSLAPIIGTKSTFTGDGTGFEGGTGTYGTFVMAIPETSSVLLGALGMLGLLRRRR